MLASASLRLEAQTADGADFLAHFNAERSRMDLEGLALSAPLERLAQARADAITAGEVLDFEPLGGGEMLRSAWDLGYHGRLVQELTAVGEEAPCEIVAGWNEALGRSDAYRRPEVREAGVGFGILGDAWLTVLVVGVPVSHDSWRKRWPGVVPREWLTADLVRGIDRKRAEAGLASLDRSEALDDAAQSAADEILADSTRQGSGSLRVSEGTLLFYKGREINVHTAEKALEAWFVAARGTLFGQGGPPAGAGLASRGRQGHLEAVWSVLIGDSAP